MLSLLKQLKQSDTGFSWQSKGVLQLASSERIRKQINTLDLPVEYVRKVSAQTASELCGLDVTAEALFFEQAGWFRPADFCQRLLGLQSSHIQLHTRTRVDGLRFESDSWQLDCGEQQTLQVDAVVLANAAKVADFQQTDFLQLQQSRGQISYMPANELSQRIQCAVCYDGYVIPEQSGIHVLGATFDTTEQSQSVLVDDHVKNIHAANQWLGQLFTETDAEAVDGRVGFRAGTTDRLPLVGPVPALNYYQTHYNDLYKGKRADLYPDARYSPGLYVNVGHGARGLTSSLLSAEIIAAQLNNEPAPVSNKLLNALHPGRFLIRKYKKGKTD